MSAQTNPMPAELRAPITPSELLALMQMNKDLLLALRDMVALFKSDTDYGLRAFEVSQIANARSVLSRAIQP